MLDREVDSREVEVEPGCHRAVVEVLEERLAERLAETFKVLSDPTRIRIISALATNTYCVHDLAQALDLTHSAISHQLALLREMDLVSYTKDGRHVYYALDDDHIRDLFQQGLAHIRHHARSDDAAPVGASA